MTTIGSHRIIIGDVLDGLRSLPDESVQCVVTSPPYWALRDYGVDGQLGLEATPDAHVSAMADVFDEVRRVLRSDGTCWVNYGDSYAGGRGNNRGEGAGGGKARGEAMGFGDIERDCTGMKPKDLVGIPWRFAFEMQRRGWWLRSDIIWHKPNPMPESCTDRPTKSHEYVFLFTKSARYFYDAEAIKEDAINAGRLVKASDPSTAKNAQKGRFGATAIGFTQHDTEVGAGRNARTVWTIATQAYSDAHFATFPEELPRRCVKAGTSERGACAECGMAWGRVVESEPNGGWSAKYASESNPHLLRRSGTHGKRASGADRPARRETKGWSPACTCDTEAKPVPCVVLDPFAGSGTTLAVACQLGRDAIGCEINPEYAALAEDRIGKALRPATHRSATKDAPAPLFGQ